MDDSELDWAGASSRSSPLTATTVAARPLQGGAP